MSRTTELSQFPMGKSAQAVLVECDRQGRILWMSDAARSRLGDSDTLSGAMLAQWTGAPKPGVSLSRIARVLEFKDSIVIGVQPLSSDAFPQYPALADLERAFLLHYFHLARAERSLSARTRSRRSGPRMVRQVENERRRLGRELHTGVGQMLAAIRLQIEVAVQQFPNVPPGVQQALDRISKLANDALDQVRSVSRRLHPPEWQRLGIDEALSQLWDISGIPQRFDAHLRIQVPPHEPDLEVKVLLYRAAQEALSNFIRHAAATRIEMSLECGPTELLLTVRDNGNGFDPALLFTGRPSVAAGIGLRSIREQAESVGGNFEIDSGRSGTTLRVSAPYTAAGV